jgi:hypothetical protein
VRFTCSSCASPSGSKRSGKFGKKDGMRRHAGISAPCSGQKAGHCLSGVLGQLGFVREMLG